MDLPRNKDGHYIDLVANIICNTSKTARRKRQRFRRIL